MKHEIPYRINLSEKEMPKAWMNIRAVMKNKPAPMLDPGTKKPVTEEQLSQIFCTELARQELNTDDLFIEIPQGVLDFYRMYRPSPLIRAYNLERELDTPAQIYYKFEGSNTSGSHKLNSAAAQVYYAKEQGITKLTTETGAGQWGTALSMAAAYYGLDLTVFMVRCSAMQKPQRRELMRTFGATVIPSPSDKTEVGRRINEKFPDTNGSLGCAISEAVETTIKTENCRYVLGSVLNHVLMHQTIIGQESKAALEKYDVYPDIVIGCAGGGSNLGGLATPFFADKISGTHDPEIIAVEPASCPSLTRGKYVYDFGDTGHMTPLMKMYTLGSEFMPSANHAGGLRYHGMSTILSQLYDDGYMSARSYTQTKVFEAAKLFAKVEGILPAPESSHAIRAAIDEAVKCKESGEGKVILFGLTGTGYFDMTAYEKFNNGIMSDYIPSDQEIEKCIPHLL